MKARTAKSPEELKALAEENGIELSDDKAKAYFDRLNNSGELSDEELDNVSGGGCGPRWIQANTTYYIVVTNHCKCFMDGKWTPYTAVGKGEYHMLEPYYASAVWRNVPIGCCGSCLYLGFVGNWGVCRLSEFNYDGPTAFKK